MTTCPNCDCRLPYPMPCCPACRRPIPPAPPVAADTAARLADLEGELGRALRRLAEVERLLGGER